MAVAAKDRGNHSSVCRSFCWQRAQLVGLVELLDRAAEIWLVSKLIQTRLAGEHPGQTQSWMPALDRANRRGTASANGRYLGSVGETIFWTLIERLLLMRLQTLEVERLACRIDTCRLVDLATETEACKSHLAGQRVKDFSLRGSALDDPYSTVIAIVF